MSTPETSTSPLPVLQQPLDEIVREMGFTKMKPKQLEAIVAVVSGNDTFVSLPIRATVVSLARPSREERGSGQTAIVELWQSNFHCPTFPRTLKWVLSKHTTHAWFTHTILRMRFYSLRGKQR